MVPMPIRTPAISYWIGLRPVHGPAKKAQDKAPRTGRTVGVRKCLCSTGSRRSTSTATFTTVKTHSSSRAVVPPSAGTSPTKVISPNASRVVNPIAMIGRAAGCVDPAERRRQHVFAAHAVDEAAGHQHVDQRAVGHREHRDDAEDPEREVRRTCLDDLQQRRLAFAKFLGRNEGYRRYRDQDVDQPGNDQPRQQDFREVADGVLALLGHVDRILEANHGEEGEGGGGNDRPERAPFGGGLEFK